MNNVIETSTRLFMAVVGPSGPGKTELTFKLLKRNLFITNLEEFDFFSKDIQPIAR